ncbi:MAG TPA: hypothetical protein P5293_00930 [Bacteroidales bacterium]|nr:hypothetical protein [Bacteroidales bacterium]
MLQRLLVNEIEKCEYKIKEALRELRDKVGLIPHSIEIELFWNSKEEWRGAASRIPSEPFEDVARVHISLKKPNGARFPRDEK